MSGTPKRRWYQFSLRTLLVATTLFVASVAVVVPLLRSGLLIPFFLTFGIVFYVVGLLSLIHFLDSTECDEDIE